MNKLLPGVPQTALALTFFLTTLAGCVSLPGSDSVPSARYTLNPAAENCVPGGAPLGLSISKLGAGLDSDRIARREAGSGEITYLGNVRWVERTDQMLEQRLAADLECRGHTIITSHHNTLSHDQLVCEVRDFNLVANGSRNAAEVALSCVLFVASGDGDVNIRSYHSTPLSRWSADSATAALSTSYKLVLEDIAANLEKLN